MHSVRSRLSRATAVSLLGTPLLTACQDLSDYSTSASRQYVGCVVPASFVLAGTDPATELCLTLDTDHLQDAPGAISSSDGRFATTLLRPVPQLWKDPLSTFTFGEGRTKNLLYMATPKDAGPGGDITVVLSLMAGGGVEVRLLRGAPAVAMGDADTSGVSSSVFAVFPTTLRPGACASLSARHCAVDAH